MKVKRSLLLENHPADSRVKLVEICPTISARWGTGGGNVPFVVHEVDDEDE